MTRFCIEGINQQSVNEILEGFNLILNSPGMTEEKKSKINKSYTSFKGMANFLIENKGDTLFYHTGHLHDVESRLFFVSIKVPKSDKTSTSASYTQALNSLGADFGHITNVEIMKVWEHREYDELLVKGSIY